MQLIKPEPLVVDGKAHYTLSSYDPPEIDVMVPSVTPEDEDRAFAELILDAGGKPEDGSNDIWIQKTFGAPGADALREAVRAELKAAQSLLVEQQKAEACANALVSRLHQRVLPQRVAQIREQLMSGFARDLAMEGVSQDDFMAANGMTRLDLQRAMDEQAQTTAEHEAAILAWAEERKIGVTDDEIAPLVGVPDDIDAQAFIDDIRAAGHLEDVRQAALQNKAMRMLVSECVCTYVHKADHAADGRQNEGPRFTLV